MFIIKMKFRGYGGKGTTCKRRGKDILACTSGDKSKNVALMEDRKLHVLIVVAQAIKRKNDCLVLEIIGIAEREKGGEKLGTLFSWEFSLCKDNGKHGENHDQ